MFIVTICQGQMTQALRIISFDDNHFSYYPINYHFLWPLHTNLQVMKSRKNLSYQAPKIALLEIFRPISKKAEESMP